VARLLLRAGSRGALPDDAIDSFAARLREPARAHASSLIYRSFLAHELPALMRGRYRETRLRTPTLLLVGARDPVVTAGRVRGYEPYADSMRMEVVPRAGHFLPEEVPDVVLAHAREALALADQPA
jgi:pimeloyl-ACP methyl ester carboxylesterase